MSQQIITSLIAIALVYVLVFLPRFNQWPGDYAGSFSGPPAAYINSLTFLFFSAAYLSTFIFLGFALSQIPNFHQFYSPVLPQAMQDFDFEALDNQFALALILLVTSLSIPVVDRTDGHWRSFLLNLARIPREAMTLKTEILDCINGIDHTRAYTHHLANNPRAAQQSAFWARCLEDPEAPAHELATRTVSGLYLIDQIRELSPRAQDLEDLAMLEKRLREIATLLPTLVGHSDELSAAPYQDELDRELSRLTEIFSCYAVKKYPSPTKRHMALNEAGFPVRKPRTGISGLVLPVLLTGAGLLACCAVVTMLGLALFDATGLPGPPTWFEVERIYRWTLGAWLSFVMAFAFAIFFNEILEPSLGPRSMLAYLLAFVFATLGSCVFFLVSRQAFSPSYIWLAINFGLLSAVTIATLRREVSSHWQALMLATRLALLYGVASLGLQILVHLHFSDWASNTANIVTVAAFGFFRGAVIGFFVAYVFVEFARAQQQSDRRHSRRFPIGKKMKLALHGEQIPIYLKDLSDEGALMKTYNQSVNVGDDVALNLGRRSPRRGRVRWRHGDLAGICFDHPEPGLGSAT